MQHYVKRDREHTGLNICKQLNTISTILSSLYFWGVYSCENETKVNLKEDQLEQFVFN